MAMYKTLGGIMNLNKIFERLVKTGGCHLWSGNVMRCGYGRVYFQGKSWRTHRLIYTLNNGPIPDGMLVCHKCDVPLCCNPEHLFLGSPMENHHDAISKKRHTHGRMVNTCKLTEEQVIEIRSRWPAESAKYGAYSRLGREYGVTEANIRCIVRGQSWKHL